MTAKEKAKDLFDKYCYAIRTEEIDSGYFTNVIYAKNCAIIAVDEIINEEEADYWIEVKNEIEKL
jgi:hypothetical protein